MEKRMNKDEVIELIESLGIDYEEFWILSTTSLVLRDAYPDAGDLDIAVTKKGLEQLKKKFNLIQKPNGFYIVTDKIECVEDTKEDWKIEKEGKYLLESLPKYKMFLEQSNRPKDKGKLEIVLRLMKERGIE